MADRRDGSDDERSFDDQVIDWAGGGGGNWEPEQPPPGDPKRDEPAPKKDPPPKAPEKQRIARSVALGGTGVVCGRFLPVHRGHQYVIDTARGIVSDLLVLVFASPGDPIPGELRVRWLRELYPDVQVALVLRTAASLLAPSVDELVRAVEAHCAHPVRYFFASEPAYAAAANAIGATFVPVDPARAAVPISGTALRANALRDFSMLPACVRPYVVRRIAILGAESTGKSTLAAQLAAAYDTVAVPEYARTLAEHTGGDLDADDLALAARGQIASEDALARVANRVMFCDTDARTVALWAERLYGDAPAWIHTQAETRPYDLVLVTSLDEPFVGRADRDRPADRAAFHARLRTSHASVVELVGDRATRLAQARAAVDALLARGGFLSARGAALI